MIHAVHTIIFENEKRSATCIAKEDSKILKLHKNDFLTIMEAVPIIAIKIMAVNQMWRDAPRLSKCDQGIKSPRAIRLENFHP